MSLSHDHCDNCYQTCCTSTDCPVIKCKFCHIPLHTCKLEDHVTGVCRRAQISCPNSGNGCRQVLIREKVPSHLPKCVASVVVCSRDRCRKLNTKSCKLQLKHMGRKSEQLALDQQDLDLNLALYDQNLIIQSYNSARSKRVRQRDPLHPDHPLIPLRNMPFDTSVPAQGSDDSSEDEKQAKREKLKKSRMVFANCYMCQIDPSVQHLHTLGNGADIEKLKKKRMTPQVLDDFHDALKLKVSIVVENVPESTLKSENVRDIKKGGTFYTLKCLKTVHRLEYGNHCLSQHTQSVDQMNEMILRCPNWSRGCMFSASRIQVKTGELKFHPHSATITHSVCPTVTLPSSESSDLTLENLPLWTYELLATYLPSSALYNLSLTSKKLRRVVFVGCNPFCYVEPVWEKTGKDGKWMNVGNVWKVSATEAPPALEWRVPVELSNHISTCPHFNATTYDEKLVPIFPKHLEESIWQEFAYELSERLIRAEIQEMQEEEEEDPLDDA